MSTRSTEELVRAEARGLVRLSYLYLLSMREAGSAAVNAFDELLHEERGRMSEEEEHAFLLHAVADDSLARLRAKPENWRPDIEGALRAQPNEARALLSRILALPVKYRAIIQLQCCEGQTAEDLSHILERSEDSINASIQRAAEMLGESGGFSADIYDIAMDHLPLDPDMENRILATLSDRARGKRPLPPRRRPASEPGKALPPEDEAQEASAAPRSGGSKRTIILAAALTALAAVCVLAAVLIVRAVKGGGGAAAVSTRDGSLAKTTYESLAASQPTDALSALQALPEASAPVGVTKDGITLYDAAYRDGWLYLGFACDASTSGSIMLCYVDGYQTTFEQIHYLPEGSAVQAAFFRSYVGFEAEGRAEESLIAVGLDYGAEQANVMLFYFNWSTGKARTPNEKQDAEWYALHTEMRKAHAAFTRFSIWPVTVNQTQGHAAVKDLSVIFTEDNAFILNMTVTGLREPLALSAVHPSVTVNGKALNFAGTDTPVDIEASGKEYPETSADESLASYFYCAAQPFDELPDAFTVEVSFPLFDATVARTREELPVFTVSGTFSKTSFSVENNG